MTRSEFRVVGESSPASPGPQEPTVRFKLAELLPLIAHAHQHGHAWLVDLADDQVIVTADLAEVLARFRDIAVTRPA